MTFKKGNIPWNKNKKGYMTKEGSRILRKKMIKNRIWNNPNSKKYWFKKGHRNWNKDLPKEQQPHFNKKHSIETRRKIQKSQPMFNKGHKVRYNRFFRTNRKIVLKRDKYTCQMCLCFGKEIHHVDQNKNNNDLNNLEVLCEKCHRHLTWELHKKALFGVKCNHSS